MLAGIFASSLALGAGSGSDIAQVNGYADAPALIALGRAGFPAATTQAPLTAFIIVLETVAGHGMVRSLMAWVMVASVVSQLVAPPLYMTLARGRPARLAHRPAADIPHAADTPVG